MAREPVLHLLNSVFDCFFRPWPGETWAERKQNAKDVVRCWWNRI